MATRLEQIAEAVHRELRQPHIKYAIGRTALAEHGPPRRVVWVRVASRIENAAERGGRQVGKGRHPVVALRLESVQIYLTERDETRTELLLDALIAALWRLCGPSAVVRGYDWVTERPGEAAHMNRTPMIQLDIVLRLPVNDGAIQQYGASQNDNLTTITGTTHTGTFGGEHVC